MIELTNSPSSEKVGWFIVGFLVRSVVYGPLTSVSNADGIGIVRETGYSIAARNRAIELFLSREARVNLVSSLWPIPSLIKTLITYGPRSDFEHRQREMIKSGVLFALMDYALLDFFFCEDNVEFIGKNLAILSKVDLSILEWEAKMDTFCMAITVALHRFFLEEDNPVVKALEKACLDIAENILSNCGPKSKFLDELKIKTKWTTDMWPRQYLKYDVRAFMGFQIEVKLPGKVERKVVAWKKMQIQEKKSYVTMNDLEIKGWIAEIEEKMRDD